MESGGRGRRGSERSGSRECMGEKVAKKKYGEAG